MKARVLIDNLTKSDLKPEWGLSIYIEYKGHPILLDAGASGLFADNAEAMGISLSQVEFAVLSHAHYDHGDGLERFFERNQKAKVYLQKDSGENCYSRNDDPFEKYIGLKKTVRGPVFVRGWTVFSPARGDASASYDGRS